MARKADHRTKLDTASIVSSGSGDVYVGGSFAPHPNIPVNGSNLPNRHPAFVGRREEMRKLIEALGSRAWIITLDGLAGVGKTTLALEAAHLIREQNAAVAGHPSFSGYIWTSARDRPHFCLDDVVREVLYVLSPFELSMKQLTPPEQLSLATRALAAEPRLLIIDNFETVTDESLHRFLRDELPSPSKVIITSRHHIRCGERVVTIGGLEEEDAMQLLLLEASRMQIPIHDDDTLLLKLIIRKAYGIPLVLRWVLESVYSGNSLDRVLASIENADAADLFNYMFQRSLSLLDPDTRTVFRSMSLLSTWSRLETIAAMNSEVVAIEGRIQHLVSVSLLEDNRNLVSASRRYQLPLFVRYLASSELAHTPDTQKLMLRRLLQHYWDYVLKLKPGTEEASMFLKEELPNIDGILRNASTWLVASELELSLQLVEMLIGIGGGHQARILSNNLIVLIRNTQNKQQAYRLLNSLSNPYAPYAFGGVVSNPDMFFGRTSELQTIQQVLENPKAYGSAIALIGPKRTGKTSLLYYLRTQPLQDVVYVYISMGVLVGAQHVGQYLFEYSREIVEEFIRQGLHVSLPSNADFEQEPYRVFRTLLTQAAKELGHRKLVLLIDEFDLILTTQDIDVSMFLSYLRNLIQMGLLSLIIATKIDLIEFPETGIVSPFLGIVHNVRIRTLHYEEAKALIEQPVRGFLDYEVSAVDALFKLTNGHPFYLQTLCSSLVQHSQTKVTFRIAPEDVEQVVVELIRDVHSRWFESLTDHMTDTERQIVELAVTRSQNKGEQFSEEQLQLWLNPSGNEQNSDDIRHALRRLLKNDILRLQDGSVYTFAIDLFRRWLATQ